MQTACVGRGKKVSVVYKMQATHGAFGLCLCEELNVIKNNINNFPVGCSGSVVYGHQCGGPWKTSLKPQSTTFPAYWAVVRQLRQFSNWLLHMLPP